jgi:hypothetical protein
MSRFVKLEPNYWPYPKYIDPNPHQSWDIYYVGEMSWYTNYITNTPTELDYILNLAKPSIASVNDEKLTG